MFMIDYKQLNWWYWFATACLLTAGLAGYQIGFVLAIGLSLIQLIHFTIREQSITAFPVQVRFWYLALLLAAYPEPMQIIYWLPAVGTWARGDLWLLPPGASSVAHAVESSCTVFGRPVYENVFLSTCAGQHPAWTAPG